MNRIHPFRKPSVRLYSTRARDDDDEKRIFSSFSFSSRVFRAVNKPSRLEKRKCTRSQTSREEPTSGKNARNTRVITQCRRTSQPDSSRMRASSSFERVFHAFLPKSTPSRTNAHRKKNERVNPLSKKKGNSRHFYPRATRANGNLRFLLRAFLPFRESFILSDGHNVRSRQNYDAGRRRCAKQAVFFFTFFFSRGGRPAQVAQPQTSSFFRFLFNSDRILSILLFGA